jgi:integrase
VSLRAAQGALRALGEALGFEAPDFTTLWKRLIKEEAEPVVHPRSREHILAIDSTGIKVTERGEWLRDIQAGHFNILGKGRRGGKWRSNPFDPVTMSELSYALELRDMEIAKARSKRPNTEVPEELLIYERAGYLHPYKRSAIDKLVRGVSERTGVPFTNHVLRRQFAKELRLSGVPISTISELLGHSDEKTTRLYLGIDMDDKSSAMLQAAKFRAAAEAAKNGRASVNGGQSGM